MQKPELPALPGSSRGRGRGAPAAPPSRWGLSHLGPLPVVSVLGPAQSSRGRRQPPAETWTSLPGDPLARSGEGSRALRCPEGAVAASRARWKRVAADAAPLATSVTLQEPGPESRRRQRGTARATRSVLLTSAAGAGCGASAGLVASRLSPQPPASWQEEIARGPFKFTQEPLKEPQGPQTGIPTPVQPAPPSEQPAVRAAGRPVHAPRAPGPRAPSAARGPPPAPRPRAPPPRGPAPQRSAWSPAETTGAGAAAAGAAPGQQQPRHGADGCRPPDRAAARSPRRTTAGKIFSWKGVPWGPGGVPPCPPPGPGDQHLQAGNTQTTVRPGPRGLERAASPAVTTGATTTITGGWST